MDVSTTPPDPQGREATADRCPVDHTAADEAREAAVPPQAAIPASALPGPRIPSALQVYMYWKRPAAFMEWCRNRYGSRFALSRGIPPRPLYVLTDPEDVKQIFLAPADVLHTGQSSAMIEKFTGQSGLAWLDEDEHKVRRKFLMPTMHGKALQRIDASISAAAEQDVASWPRGKTTALHPYIHRFTLNVIREVIFGEAPPKCWDELLDVLTRMMRFNDRIM